MSGGHFEYYQYHISRIADDIETLIENKSRDYSIEEVQRFQEAVYVLKKAFIYANRIDYLLSGDDGTESFLYRIKTELNFLDRMHKEKDK